MYVKVENNIVSEYPYSPDKLKRDNPNTSFPKAMTDELLNSYGVYIVSAEQMPDYDYITQKVVTSETPELVDGSWTLTRTVVSRTDEEVSEIDAQFAKQNRTKRNTLIAETDWWASSDLTMTAEQSSYRQALRDITAHANWPHLSDSDWPTKP